MDEDLKKVLAAVGIIAGMVVLGEHVYNQEKSLYSQLVRVFRK